jgi:two-component system LytT family sensor kinase
VTLSRWVPRGTVLPVLLGWTILALLESAKWYLTMRHRGFDVTWQLALIGNVPWWYAWALLTPVIARLAERFEISGAAAWRSAAVHGAAAVGCTLVHLVAVGALFFHTVSYRLPGNTLTAEVTGIVRSFFILDLLTYAAILGACHAVLFYRRAQAERLTAASLAAAVSEARLNALRMELHPHFLFNALNAVSGLVRKGEQDRAVLMLARVGDLLRRTLSRDSAPELPLARELELLQGYLEIERVRFGDRLTVDVEVDDEALGVTVPTLFLQPLVENAVRHGVSPHPGPGRVAIRAARENGTLLVRVENTGAPAGGPGAPVVEGVGLSNTRARLEQRYGSRASLSAGRTADGGFAVAIRLPADGAAAHAG